MSILRVKKTNDTAVVPTQGTPHSAGYDLYSIETHILMPMDIKLFKTGLILEIPTGHYGRIAPRSGLAFKNGIDVMAGVIDEDYRGELGILLINLGKTEKEIKIGDKIAQIIIEPYKKVDFLLVDDLSDTQRGTNGFGSTDSVKEEIELPPSLKEHYDKMHMTLLKKDPEGTILDKYTQTGGVPVPAMSYSELMKHKQEKFGI